MDIKNITHKHYVFGRFAPLAILPPRTFCPTDVMSPDILSLLTFCPAERFVPPDALSLDVMSRDVSPPDVLSGHRKSYYNFSICVWRLLLIAATTRVPFPPVYGLVYY